MRKIEGWYDNEGDFHKRFSWDRWQESLEGTDWGNRYNDLNRLVINFADEGEPDDYKTIWVDDWAEYYDDKETFWEALEDWYASEYGEATQ